MSFIAGSQEWLKTNGYRAERTGPAQWTIFDEEEDDKIVCRAATCAEAVRELIRLRFEEPTP